MSSQWLSAIFGLMFLAYAGVALYVRTTTPQMYRHLVQMKETYGEKAGSTVHLVLLIILPAFAGLYFIVRALMGKGLF